MSRGKYEPAASAAVTWPDAGWHKTRAVADASCWPSAVVSAKAIPSGTQSPVPVEPWGGSTPMMVPSGPPARSCTESAPGAFQKMRVRPKPGKAQLVMTAGERVSVGCAKVVAGRKAAGRNGLFHPASYYRPTNPDTHTQSSVVA